MNKTKIMAFYLPQYHTIIENNNWWGYGFTDWINVKNSQKFFYKHEQPKVPLNDNYYDLKNIETLQWQSNLMNEFKIDGLVFYHYWFEGKRLLEKPAELLLSSNINMSFCFCWANHTWKKTWNGTYEVLMKQTYGDKKEWDYHFNYLLKFFKDHRYIKVDNKPVFMLYESKSIDMLDERIKFYNDRAINEGFDGIYIIESINHVSGNKNSTQSSAVVLREPSVGINSAPIYKKIMHKLKTQYKKNYLYFPLKYNYRSVAERAIKVYNKLKVEQKFYCSFTGWDSTPRHKRRGYVITKSNVENFVEHFSYQYHLANKNKHEFIFINAWNEWAEGMYLEPDNKNRYAYLEAIKNIVIKE